VGVRAPPVFAGDEKRCSWFAFENKDAGKYHPGWNGSSLCAVTYIAGDRCFQPHHGVKKNRGFARG
jgi:hypothetical protein